MWAATPLRASPGNSHHQRAPLSPSSSASILTLPLFPIALILITAIMIFNGVNVGGREGRGGRVRFHLSLFIPCPAPSSFSSPCPWLSSHFPPILSAFRPIRHRPSADLRPHVTHFTHFIILYTYTSNERQKYRQYLSLLFFRLV